MRCLPAIVALLFSAALLSCTASGQEAASLVVKALDKMLPGGVHGNVEYDPTSGTFRGTNGVYLSYGAVVLTADSASGDPKTGQVEADGHVHIETGDGLWVGEHIKYNYLTHKMQTEEFRTGRTPVFAGGESLSGDLSQKIYTGGSVFVTSDDFSDPAVRVKASEVRIIANKSVEMWNAVLWAEGVPIFYFPYYKRNLGPHANNLNVLPGYRTAYGGFLLGTYTWYLNDTVDGRAHLDYRTRRGAGFGPDVNLHMDRWGEASIHYYFLHDVAPYAATNGLPIPAPIPENRQRLNLSYQATPFTNVNVKSVLDYQSDPMVEREFFESEYSQNVQPYSFVEVNPYWENWSLDAEATPRVNTFFDQVARLPDVRLDGLRQQIFDTPLYYDSENSVGYFRRYTQETSGIDQTGYSAARADTYHQILLPWTFFNWLNVAPRVGERLTYYSDESGPKATNTENYRAVFNTGVSTSFKASQLWTGATNSLLQVDGLRHIIEPSVNYVFVPTPSSTPNQLPQFDYDQPSLLLLPLDYPDYDNIDSIDSQNVIRFGLRNTLQTKRDGEIENLVDWNLMLDWRLAPNRSSNAPTGLPTSSNLGAPGPQRTFDDLYSHLVFRPRSWLTAESQVREDINVGRLNLAFHQLVFSPNERWSWGVGDWYLGSGFPTGTNNSENLITSTFFYRVNDNYGFRMTHYFDARTGHLQEQFYTLYRDMRSWTAGLTFRVVDNSTGPKDYTIAFSFSLKLAPKAHVGDDAVRPYHLVGD